LYENLFDFYEYDIFVPVLGCSCFSILISSADLGDSLVILFEVFIFSCLGSVLLVHQASSLLLIAGLDFLLVAVRPCVAQSSGTASLPSRVFLVSARRAD
jgi:hypothetical protein